MQKTTKKNESQGSNQLLDSFILYQNPHILYHGLNQSWLHAQDFLIGDG